VAAFPSDPDRDPLNQRLLLRALTVGLILTFVVLLLVQMYGGAVRATGDAMEPTILAGDHVLFLRRKEEDARRSPRAWQSEFARAWEARPGDVVLVSRPDGSRGLLILRCAAVNGRTVHLRNGILYVNGERRNEPWARAGASVRADFGPYKVPPGGVFLLGDHRDVAGDSREWGAVPGSRIVGQAMLVYWSWDVEHGKPRFDRIGRFLR